MIDAHHGIAGKIAFHCAATFKLPLHIRSSQLGADPSNSPRMPKTSYKKHEDLKPRLAWGGFNFFFTASHEHFFRGWKLAFHSKISQYPPALQRKRTLPSSFTTAGKTCRLKENATLGLKQSLYMTAAPCRCSHSMSFLFASQKWLCLSRGSEYAGKSRALKYHVQQYCNQHLEQQIKTSKTGFLKTTLTQMETRVVLIVIGACNIQGPPRGVVRTSRPMELSQGLRRRISLRNK